MTKTMTLDGLKLVLQAHGMSADALAQWDGGDHMEEDEDSVPLAHGSKLRIARPIGWMDMDKALKDRLSMIMPEDVDAFLQDNAGKDVTFELNTPGGSIFGGMDIANRIIAHEGKTTAMIMGVAASVGSVISAACDEVVMFESSMQMLHAGHTVRHRQRGRAS